MVSSEKNQFSPLLAPLEKFWKNPLMPPPPLEKIIPKPMNVVCYERDLLYKGLFWTDTP